MMKKLLYTLSLVLAVAVSAVADDFKKTKEDATVTSYVQKKFESEYSTAESVTWTIVDNLYKASFVLDGKPMSVFYDWENKLVATTSAAEKEELTEKVRERIARNYKEYEIGSVLKQFDGRTSYFAVLQKEDKRIVVRISGNCVFFHKRLN